MANPTKSELVSKLNEVAQALKDGAHPDVVAMLDKELPRVLAQVQSNIRIGESSLALALAFLSAAQGIIESKHFA